MTTIHDLGPLEQAVLQALVLAESIDAPLSRASIWRTLPGYHTALPNVRAALAPGAPLRQFVAEAKDRFVLADRADALRDMATRQGRADAVWRDLKGRLRGLSKLPWVDAVGIGGRMAWGVLDSDAVDLVILAEPRRAHLARAAVEAWIVASRESRLRVAAVLDVDSPELPEGDQHDAWWLLSLRPVSNEPAFHALWDANPWAGAWFPNFDTEVTGGLPEYLVTGRIDGRLASLRRGLPGRALLASVAQNFVGDRPADTALPFGEPTDRAQFDARVRAVFAWSFAEPEAPASTSAGPVDEPAVAPVTEPGAAQVSEATEPPQASPTPRPTHVASRRQRGATHQRASGARSKRGRTSPASPESGQRGRQ